MYTRVRNIFLRNFIELKEYFNRIEVTLVVTCMVLVIRYIQPYCYVNAT